VVREADKSRTAYEDVTMMIMQVMGPSGTTTWRICASSPAYHQVSLLYGAPEP
jgi:hypothetical protein